VPEMSGRPGFHAGLRANSSNKGRRNNNRMLRDLAGLYQNRSKKPSGLDRDERRRTAARDSQNRLVLSQDEADSPRGERGKIPGQASRSIASDTQKAAHSNSGRPNSAKKRGSTEGRPGPREFAQSLRWQSSPRGPDGRGLAAGRRAPPTNLSGELAT